MFRSKMDRFEDALRMADMASDMGRGAFRARRGMIEPAILEALLDRPMHGYEIMDKIEESSNGMWRPSAGSVYPTLQMLEEKGLVTVKTDGDKKVYQLTDAGKEHADHAKDHQEHMQSFWADKKDESRHMNEVRTEVHDIFKMMRHFRGQKSPEKIDKLLKLLRTFKQSLTELIEE
jgi:DNA-binding PadR family transcriptional regulator